MNRMTRLLMALSVVFAAVATALPVTPALAVDMAGKTIVAKGIEAVTMSNSRKETITWKLEIYFGTKGNRFVLIEGARGTSVIQTAGNRVLIPVGKDKGSKRRKDGNFSYFFSLQQSASSLQVRMESRGKDTGYSNDTWIFVIALGSGSCRVDEFRHIPDARLNYSSVVATEGDCTVGNGPPSGLTSND